MKSGQLAVSITSLGCTTASRTPGRDRRWPLPFLPSNRRDCFRCWCDLLTHNPLKSAIAFGKCWVGPWDKRWDGLASSTGTYYISSSGILSHLLQEPNWNDVRSEYAKKPLAVFFAGRLKFMHIWQIQPEVRTSQDLFLQVLRRRPTKYHPHTRLLR